MSEERSSLAKDIEDLVSKSIEANKVFMNEGLRMVKQFASKTGDKKNINLFQPELISNAINAYAKLNIQHLKNVIDLGVSLAKQTGTQPTAADDATNAGSTGNTGPAFVLNGSGAPATNVMLQFLLDNVKDQPVTCRLVNTVYAQEADNAVQQHFKTEFSPQSFTLEAGDSQTVNIKIGIPENANPGIYNSNVQVEGFEPAYFSIYLTVTEKQSKTSVHGSRKGK